MGFHWSLSDSMHSQVSRTLLSIQGDLNNTVVWIVLIYPQISKSSIPLFRSLETIPTIPTTIGIKITLIFYSFLSSQAKSKYLSLFSLSMIFTCFFFTLSHFFLTNHDFHATLHLVLCMLSAAASLWVELVFQT